jgi:hypothetical protein
MPLSRNAAVPGVSRAAGHRTGIGMANYCRLLLVSLICLSMNSCIFAATHVVGTAMRSFETGDDFAVWKTQMPAIPPATGRLIVYPGGSLSMVYEATSIGTGGDEHFVVDRDVCKVLGHSFVFLDLAAGKHVISADHVSKFLDGYEIGRYKLDVTIAPSTVTYVKIDKEKTGEAFSHHYVPKLVEAAAAESALRGFPIYSDGLKCKINQAKDRTP